MEMDEGPQLHVKDHMEEATTSFALNVTISKDITDISDEQRLLFVKRGKGDEEDQDAVDNDSSDSEAEDSGQDEQDDGEENQVAADGGPGSKTLHGGQGKRDDGNDDMNPFEKETHNVVIQNICEETVKESAGLLHAQIRSKLASIPGLDLPNEKPQSELIEYLMASMAKLSVENRMLKEALQATTQCHPAGVKTAVAQAPAVENINEAPVFEEVHQVRCAHEKTTYFRDVPRMFKGDLKSDHLRGRHSLENMLAYLNKNKQVVFVVVQWYRCWCDGGTDYLRLVGHKDGRMVDNSQPAETGGKHIMWNKNIHNAVKEIAKAHPHAFEGWDLAKLPSWSYEPHFVFYVHYTAFLKYADSSNLSDFDSQSIKLICNWVSEERTEDWNEADEMFKRGKVTAKHFRKLFRPEELIVHRERDEPGITRVLKMAPYPSNPQNLNTWGCHAWSFNGRFTKTKSGVNLSCMFSQSGSVVRLEDGEVDITSISAFPLRFAEPELYNNLLARGSKFWNCRKKKIISYHDPDLDGEDRNQSPAEHRFMVDYNIFKRMHPNKPLFDTEADDLGSEAMNKKDPPDDHFLALLPPEIHAFDLSAKTWKLLRVDRITDVTWNKDAFKRLVLPKETKELIQASVMAQGRLFGASPDIIAGKGQGLLILLHGGPGTGKTLTAESIAETQERPLYRVTCGDIGIEPENMERYLESVFAIGKAWGCVVLLDEADVFLEERNPTDQKQNAIVSIFLRLLEYYDGILILTTNRVGTFDEAFKSRIHLALRYDNLKEDQRVEIWRNLFSMLKSRDDERIDVNDLFMNVNKLAREDLNGRQIRNVITLARYLAKFRGEMLVYRHVQDALASVVKFDQYLLGLRGPDDTWAAEQRLR